MHEVEAIAARVVAREGGQDVGPWTLEVYPTQRCNLDCAFCDTTDRHRPPVAELEPARWLTIVDEAAALGARRIMVLGGGEPLLAAATAPLLRRAAERGLQGFLTTNGTRLLHYAELLVEVGWGEVHVSIDGADAATHDRLRGRRGAFRSAVQGLCRLRQLRDGGGKGLPRLGLHTVLTRENVDQLDAILRLARALGCRRVDFDALVAYRPEQQALALSPEQARALPARAAAGLRLATSLGLQTTLAHFTHPSASARGTRPPPPGEGAGLRAAPCLKAWHHLVIQADGRTSPCCVLAGTGPALGGAPLARFWAADPTLGSIRAGMRAGRPTGRCAECSENILAHERAVRAALPA